MNIRACLLLLLSFLIYGNAGICQLFNPFPGTVVFESTEDPIVKKVASPSIVILSNGDYLVSHDFDRGTSVHLSKDRGKTWQPLSRVSPLIWATIFEHKGDVYLMGTSKGWGNLIIFRSTDNGQTWSTPSDERTGILEKGLFHTGPVPVVKHNGKIWRAYEEAFDAENRRDFHAFAVCADEGADLLKASSWKRTNSIRFNEKWLNAKRPNWFEGNIVVTPEGKLIDFMRLETWSAKGVKYEVEGMAKGKPRNEIAAIIDIDDKKMKMKFANTPESFVHFPGAESKFTIRYDPASKLYWTITNKISSFIDAPETYNGNWHQRNLLILMSSKDLRHWEIRKKILRYNEGAHLRTWDTFGFQYTDWVFDQNDIVFVSRTSWYGSRYHDANMITFHRIEDFRKADIHIEPQDLKAYTKHPILIEVPVARLSDTRYTLGDFDVETRIGAGLKQSSPGVFEIQNPQKIAKNNALTLKAGRYFDIKLSNSKIGAFSLETLDYTPASNDPEVKLRWEFSLDGKKFTPITNYYIPVENKPDGSVAEPTIFLQVYRGLNKINGTRGVIIRCHVISMSSRPTCLKLKNNIQLGGRKL